ncbi:uncharacterized protein DMENIID0001_003700 [Sergentomyia squamirostris]
MSDIRNFFKRKRDDADVPATTAKKKSASENQEAIDQSPNPGPFTTSKTTEKMITAVDIDFDVIKSPNQPAAVHVPCQEERAQSTKERPDVSAKARGFLIALEIFTPVEKLSKILQSKVQTVSGSREAAKFTIAYLEEIRNLDLPELSSRTQLRKYPNSTPYQVAEKVYEEAVTTAIEEIQRRFDQKDFKAYQHLENFLISPDKENEEIASNWGFRLDDLKLELRMLKRNLKAFIQKLKPCFRRSVPCWNACW